MRRTAIPCLLAVAACDRAPQPTSRPSVAPGPDEPVWHYEGAEGPEHWGALSPRFEMHMVHRSTAGALVVVAVLIAEGRHNRAFDPVWNNLPRAKGVETHYEHVTVDVDALLPSSHASYRYQGSLTTPPCTEGVEWIVLSTPIALDRRQIETFEAIIHDNSRPVQALNGRMVLGDIVH